MSHDEDWQGSPRQRAGDSERQEAIDMLNRGWRDGRLTRGEFHDRSTRAISAVYVDELEGLLDDLGGLFAGGGLAAPTAVVDYRAPTLSGPVQDTWQSERDEAALPAVYAPAGTKGTAVSIGIMSGVERAAEWTVAPNHLSIAFWGGTEIDLRDAIFTSETTVISCFAIMGGTDVIVPPEMDVEVHGIGFMGAFAWEKPRMSKATVRAADGNPRVIINGLGFMGGVNIVRRERGVDD